MQKNILASSVNLDLLRAIAVTYVVVDHTSKFFGYTSLLGRNINALGLMGVLFFFVHTCTVLMLSLARLSTGKMRTQAWITFYFRRIFRIYPLSLFATGVVLLFHIASSAIIGPYTLSAFFPTGRLLLLHMLLLQNIWPGDAHQIIGVLWSLPYEVQMYVVLPLLFLVDSKLRSVWPLVALWAASFVPAHFFTQLQFGPDFLAGVIAYSLARRSTYKLWPAWTLPLLITVATILFIVDDSRPVGGLICLSLGFLLPRVKPIASQWLNRITYNVAKYSYGIYLSHLFSMWIAFDKIPRFHALAYGMLLVAIPVALFHCIESPMMKLGVQVGDWITDTHTRTVRVDAMAKTAP